MKSPPKIDSDHESAVRKLLQRGRVGRARVRRHRQKDNLYWELDFGYPGGKRFRRYARSDTAAYRKAIEVTRELNEHGAVARALTTAQRWEAADCIRKLAAVGASLSDAANEFLKRHPKAGAARSILQVIAEVVAVKKAGKRDPRYVRDLEYKLRCFEKACPGGAIAAPTTELCEGWIAQHAWAAGTVWSHVDSWNVMFNYAVDRGYRHDNPCAKLELPRRVRPEPEIFKVDQVRQIMGLAVAALPQCRAWAAIGLFAGLRPLREIGLLQWEKVSFGNKTITVDMPTAKKRERRVVDMSPNLIAWLQPIARASGPVIEESVNDLRVAMRDAMGLKRWPHDVMRHCYATYHFAKHRDVTETTYQMGHGRDTDIFYQHYRALVEPAAADAFWEIAPDTVGPGPVSAAEAAAMAQAEAEFEFTPPDEDWRNFLPEGEPEV